MWLIENNFKKISETLVAMGFSQESKMKFHIKLTACDSLVITFLEDSFQIDYFVLDSNGNVVSDSEIITVAGRSFFACEFIVKDFILRRVNSAFLKILSTNDNKL